MADKYTDGFDNKPKNPVFSTGQAVKRIRAKVEIAIADANGQKYIIAQGLSIDDIVLSIMLPKGWSAVTSGTDFDIGLGYIDEAGDIVAVEVDVFVDGKNMSAGLTSALDICESSSTDTIGEALATEVSTEEAKSKYIMYMTGNIVGSAAVDLDIDIVIAPSA